MSSATGLLPPPSNVTQRFSPDPWSIWQVAIPHCACSPQSSYLTLNNYFNLIVGQQLHQCITANSNAGSKAFGRRCDFKLTLLDRKVANWFGYYRGGRQWSRRLPLIPTICQQITDHYRARVRFPFAVGNSLRLMPARNGDFDFGKRSICDMTGFQRRTS